jgi:hypothetical protein
MYNHWILYVKGSESNPIARFTVDVKELSYEIKVWKGTSVEELLILINSYDQ